MCYLSSLNPSLLDEKEGSPCMLHLDPIEGKQEIFEGQVRSYILQAWMERFQASDNMDPLHSLVQMKYVEAEVPQQGNCYDCGLYVLHYIEEFLRKSTSQDLRFSSSEAGAHFTGPNFEQEISGKCMRIRKLILELCGASQQRVGKRLDIQPKPQQRASLVHRPRPQRERLPKPRKESKSKKWKEKDTSILLQCMVDGGRFCKVFSLHECQKLEDVNLGAFLGLRCLDIFRCGKPKVIAGWEDVKELGWVEIRDCYSYDDIPKVRHLSSLREFCFYRYNKSTIPWQLYDFSQCVQLYKLIIFDSEHLLESVDLKALKFLQVLSFGWCSALSTIQGLSGLHALTLLNLNCCYNLRVPDLGCLKALTHLNLKCSGIEEIAGVEELHFLTSLDLCCCKSLKELPFLGHLKALAYLDLSGSGVEEIRGVEDLVSLERLVCRGSQLKRLPNLQHLPRLREVEVGGTPLTTSDPSWSSYGKDWLYCNGKEEGKVLVDDVSDISDSEYIPSGTSYDSSDED